jgi:hypothetical protein
MPRYNYKPQSAKSLRAIAKELEKARDAVASMADTMEADKIKTLETRNNIIGIRGLDYIGKFVEAVREAHLEFRRQRGDFEA